MSENARKRPRGFIKWNPRPETLALIELVKAVLREYREYLPMTLRRVIHPTVPADCS
jgi:hypothetical protein